MKKRATAKRMTNGRLVKRGTAIGLALALGTAAGAAQANNITVTTTGAPVNGKCSLTQAIQAAVTNTAVGGTGGCPAGSGINTDTIILAANTTYQDYGKALLVPTTGGPLVIRGTLSNGEVTTKIVGANYGFPSPNPLNPDICLYPAALFTGGSNLTVKDLLLHAKNAGTGHTGICQYAGTLKLDNMDVGYFQAGGIWSYPNTTGNSRTLTMTNVAVYNNVSPVTGAGISLHENMTVSITGSTVQNNQTNESGGGLTWYATGSLTVTDTAFFYNDAQYSSGGGLYLYPQDSNATATLKGINVQINTADQQGGGIWVGPFGTNKLTIDKSAAGPSNIRSNLGTQGDGMTYDPAQNIFNADPWTYDAIWCTGATSVGGLLVAPWTAHSPILKGGTGTNACVFD